MRCERNLSWQSTYNKVEWICVRGKGYAHFLQPRSFVLYLVPTICTSISVSSSPPVDIHYGMEYARGVTCHESQTWYICPFEYVSISISI